MKYLAVFLLTCFCCLSCTTKQEKEHIPLPKETEVVKVDFGKEYKEKKFPNTSYYIKIQKLEENDKYPIGEIDKLIVYKEKIYLLDRHKAKALFVYGMDGKFIRVIDKTGQGPGEYSYLTDFDIEKKTGNIILMGGPNKFIVYSPKGEYIREFTHTFLAVSFSLDNEDNILTYNGNIQTKDSDAQLKRMDLNGNFLNGFFPPDPSTLGMPMGSICALQQFKNRMYFLPRVDNRIYALDGDKFAAAYQIDFGKDWPSKEFCEEVHNMHPVRTRDLMNEKEYVRFLNFNQTDDVLQLDFYKDKRYAFYYHKKTKKSLLIAMEDESFTFPLGTYDNQFVCVKYHEETGQPRLYFYTVNFDL